jgi:hypothetical protein
VNGGDENATFSRSADDGNETVGQDPMQSIAFYPSSGVIASG